MSLPDFSRAGRAEAFGEPVGRKKRALGDMIRQDLDAGKSGDKFPGVRVKIGAENRSPDLKNLSLISSTYTLGDRRVGGVGHHMGPDAWNIRR
ncbi:MAG: hypothetical protein IPP09_06735 [Elusimicrobia bacterium]|nr:hypothetical protein [Elusimicrobiota bacterium]